MTEQQYNHLNQILDTFNHRTRRKYEKGVKEYGTNLWEYSSTWLLDAAIDEAIDQVTYLLTLKEVLEKNRNIDL